jgi:hypothetical protein
LTYVLKQTTYADVFFFLPNSSLLIDPLIFRFQFNFVTLYNHERDLLKLDRKIAWCQIR